MNTTANKITIMRIILVPVFMVLLYMGYTYWALAVYIIACLSDFIDGKIDLHGLDALARRPAVLDIP